MARSKSSDAWLRRHVSDPYVRRAQERGFRSRAAFKLIEIDDRDRLFVPGRRVVDLGAAPGGWSQVAAARVGAGGRVIAVDLIEMAPLEGVTFVRGDFTDAATAARVAAALAGASADVVLSDMAPSLSGVAATDQARASLLGELAVEFALQHLGAGGALLMKAFHGADFPPLLASLRRRFAAVAVRKPAASRAESSEQYLVARRS